MLQSVYLHFIGNPAPGTLGGGAPPSVIGAGANHVPTSNETDESLGRKKRQVQEDLGELAECSRLGDIGDETIDSLVNSITSEDYISLSYTIVTDIETSEDAQQFCSNFPDNTAISAAAAISLQQCTSSSSRFQGKTFPFDASCQLLADVG